MKYFAVSDIHSYYKPFIKALNNAGFDPSNTNHCLVVCGDLFDRGPDTIEVMEYIQSLPNKKLIWGNHEHLLCEVLYSHTVTQTDIQNGTERTLDALLHYFGDNKEGSWANTMEGMFSFWSSFTNYFETDNYIFVHSWIPTNPKLSGNTFNPGWRSEEADWGKAIWQNPYNMAAQGLNQTGKTIVFGHWHCSTGWYRQDPWHGQEFGEKAIWDIFHNEKYNYIAIDRCTAYTGECNVLVVDDNGIKGDELNESIS